MKYIKCPRCELNYILTTENVCTICKKELAGEKLYQEYCLICGRILKDDEIDVCVNCNEDTDINLNY